MEHVTDGVCDGVCDGVWLFGKDSFEECPLTGASKIIGRFLYKQPYVISYKFQGGISHGNALGNVYNWGDIRIADPPALVQRGSVFLYFSNKNPSGKMGLVLERSRGL